MSFIRVHDKDGNPLEINTKNVTVVLHHRLIFSDSQELKVKESFDQLVSKINHPEAIDGDSILSKCPFCGNEAKLSSYNDSRGHECFFVHCIWCGCRTKGFIDEGFAVETWNNRV